MNIALLPLTKKDNIYPKNLFILQYLHSLENQNIANIFGGIEIKIIFHSTCNFHR